VNNKSIWGKLHYCSLLCGVIAYIPLLIVIVLFLCRFQDMGDWPQFGLGWALLWSISAFALGKLPSVKNMKSAKIGVVLASFPIGLFIGVIIAGLIIRAIAAML